MKRSEAVLFIAESLIEPHSDDPIIEAGIILKKLEKYGMKPPRYTGLIANGKKYDRNTDSGRDVQDFYDWEPEDET